MSENEKDSAQEKTEQPTQRKLDKAREDGKAVTSKAVSYTHLTLPTILLV